MPLLTHASLGSGESFSEHDLLDEHLRGSDPAVLASDMDQTMITADVGALAFVELLQSATFFTRTPEEFRTCILPDITAERTSTHAFLREGAANEMAGVSAKECQLALETADTLATMYETLWQKLQHTPDDPSLRGEMTAFTRLVLQFDRMLIKLKSQHPCAQTSNALGSAFSRYRLFQGHNPDSLEKTVQQLIQLDHNHPERILPFQVGDAHKKEMDRKIQVNTPIFSLLRKIKDRRDPDMIAITASPVEIASAILRESIYCTLFNPKGIRATQLQRCHSTGLLTGRLDGPMVAGIRKRIILEEMCARENKKLIAALGDSPGSDAPMGALALSQGGVFVIAHDPERYDITHSEFDKKLTSILGAREVDLAKNRIWYVESRPGDAITGDAAH